MPKTIWRPDDLLGDLNDMTSLVTNAPASTFYSDLSYVPPSHGGGLFTALADYPSGSTLVRMWVRVSSTVPNTINVYGSADWDADHAFGEEHQWTASFTVEGTTEIEEISSPIYGFGSSLGNAIEIAPLAHFFGDSVVHEMWIEYGEDDLPCERDDCGHLHSEHEDDGSEGYGDGPCTVGDPGHCEGFLAEPLSHGGRAPSGSLYGANFDSHHGWAVFEYVCGGTGTEGVMVKGPTDGQMHSETHCGAFAVPATDQVSMQVQVYAGMEISVDVLAQWYDRHPRHVLVPASLDTLVTDVRVAPSTWAQIDVTKPEAGHSHWRPVLRFYGPDRGPLTAGVSILLDCLYVPDNGLSVAAQPYLDGDQPGGVWEGPQYASTSIHGPVDESES